MNGQSVKISLFHCSNSLTPEEIAHTKTSVKEAELASISLPCSGKVNLLYLLKAIETGSDGVMLLTCKTGDCKFLQGNLRAQKRTESVAELLEESGLTRDHVKVIQMPKEHNKEHIVNEVISYSKQLQSLVQLKGKKVKI